MKLKLFFLITCISLNVVAGKKKQKPVKHNPEVIQEEKKDVTMQKMVKILLQKNPEEFNRIIEEVREFCNLSKEEEVDRIATFYAHRLAFHAEQIEELYNMLSIFIRKEKYAVLENENFLNAFLNDWRNNNLDSKLAIVLAKTVLKPVDLTVSENIPRYIDFPNSVKFMKQNLEYAEAREKRKFVSEFYDAAYAVLSMYNLNFQPGKQLDTSLFVLELLYKKFWVEYFGIAEKVKNNPRWDISIEDYNTGFLRAIYKLKDSNKIKIEVTESGVSCQLDANWLYQQSLIEATKIELAREGGRRAELLQTESEKFLQIIANKKEAYQVLLLSVEKRLARLPEKIQKCIDKFQNLLEVRERPKKGLPEKTSELSSLQESKLPDFQVVRDALQNCESREVALFSIASKSEFPELESLRKILKHLSKEPKWHVRLKNKAMDSRHFIEQFRLLSDEEDMQEVLQKEYKKDVQSIEKVACSLQLQQITESLLWGVIFKKWIGFIEEKKRKQRLLAPPVGIGSETVVQQGRSHNPYDSSLVPVDQEGEFVIDSSFSSSGGESVQPVIKTHNPYNQSLIPRDSEYWPTQRLLADQKEKKDSLTFETFVKTTYHWKWLTFQIQLRII